ncbi:hypothetical protein PIB30_117525 [Stylosanthes scabra]|uniref:Uncharacterized protein n=1 Tax=Stylosanthes scabra TaxID=79078 RepID=A0ABU6TEL4_9FABA|nr:hypothetical protein [Stylosanthes scabra]
MKSGAHREGVKFMEPKDETLTLVPFSFYLTVTKCPGPSRSSFSSFSFSSSAYSVLLLLFFLTFSSSYFFFFLFFVLWCCNCDSERGGCCCNGGGGGGAVSGGVGRMITLINFG